jgi:hypothetical protein
MAQTVVEDGVPMGSGGLTMLCVNYAALLDLCVSVCLCVCVCTTKIACA